jgi:hypothetical protein
VLLYHHSGIILLIDVDIILACEAVKGTRAFVDEVIQSDVVSVALREDETEAICADNELIWFVLSICNICDFRQDHCQIGCLRHIVTEESEVENSS